HHQEVSTLSSACLERTSLQGPAHGGWWDERRLVEPAGINIHPRRRRRDVAVRGGWRGDVQVPAAAEGDEFRAVGHGLGRVARVGEDQVCRCLVDLHSVRVDELPAGYIQAIIYISEYKTIILELIIRIATLRIFLPQQLPLFCQIGLRQGEEPLGVICLPAGSVVNREGGHRCRRSRIKR